MLPHFLFLSSLVWVSKFRAESMVQFSWQKAKTKRHRKLYLADQGKKKSRRITSRTVLPWTSKSLTLPTCRERWGVRQQGQSFPDEEGGHRADVQSWGVAGGRGRQHSRGWAWLEVPEQGLPWHPHGVGARAGERGAGGSPAALGDCSGWKPCPLPESQTTLQFPHSFKIGSVKQKKAIQT